MKVFILLVIPTLLLASQFVPLIPYTPGMVTKNKGANLEIQIIYDPMCSDSANFDKIWTQVQAAIDGDPALKDKIGIRYLIVALPYHITAHRLTMALMYLRNVKGDQIAMSALRYFFNNQNLYDQSVIGQLTINQYLMNVAKALGDAYNVEPSALLSAMQRSSTFDQKSRYEQKFIQGILGHCGAPRALMNWNQIDTATDFTLTQWISFLKSYV